MARRPKKAAAPDPALNADGSLKRFPWVFLIPEGGRAGSSHKQKIPTEHPIAEQIMAAIGKAYIPFSERRFATTDPVVAKFLRELIRDGIVPFTEDLSAFPLQCQYVGPDGKPCTWERITSGKADQAALYKHMITEHIDQLSGRADELHPIPAEA